MIIADASIGPNTSYSSCRQPVGGGRGKRPDVREQRPASAASKGPNYGSVDVIKKAVGMDLEGDQSRPRLVAVGVDGSPESIAAARYAVHAASQRGMDLLLVHAYELPPIHAPINPALLDACQESARQLVAYVAAQLVLPSGMRIETYIQQALPAGMLLQAAEEVPLLVVGQTTSRWLSGWVRPRGMSRGPKIFLSSGRRFRRLANK
jgi:nucleotide-binding universal stress UspA family protein